MVLKDKPRLRRPNWQIRKHKPKSKYRKLRQENSLGLKNGTKVIKFIPKLNLDEVTIVKASKKPTKMII